MTTSNFPPVIVADRLFFAEQRLEDLDRLEKSYGGELGRAQPRDRQQSMQEFFFHLVGAIQFLAQVINESRRLMAMTDVTPQKVWRRLRYNDPIGRLLAKLYPITRNRPLPQDPYSEEGCHFRILVMRHWVCHYSHNPYAFRGGSTPPTSLLIDPGNRSLGSSQKPVLDELYHFFELVNDKCQQILRQL